MKIERKIRIYLLNLALMLLCSFVFYIFYRFIYFLSLLTILSRTIFVDWPFNFSVISVSSKARCILIKHERNI